MTAASEVFAEPIIRTKRSRLFPRAAALSVARQNVVDGIQIIGRFVRWIGEPKWIDAAPMGPKYENDEYAVVYAEFVRARPK